MTTTTTTIIILIIRHSIMSSIMILFSKAIYKEPIRRDDRMSTASISYVGRSGYLDRVSLNPGRVKSITLKCILVAS